MTRARILVPPATVKFLLSAAPQNGFGKERPSDMERRVGSDGPLLDDIALLIDGAQDSGDEAVLRRVIQRCDEVEPDLLAASVPVLLYFRANAYAALLMISGRNKEWSWRNLELEAQILNLRRAIAHEAFGTLAELRRLQILTNLASGLNHLGRSVEALEVYDNALAIDPKFGMALGNRGLARSRFARSLWVQSHLSVGMMLAHEDLKRTQSADIVWDGRGYRDAREIFGGHINRVERAVDADALRASYNSDSGQLGRSKGERAYRAWAVRSRLFINPLNVFDARAIGATDCLTLPPHRAKLEEPPQYIAWFNVVVQEFIAARLLLYESTVLRESHFADNAVTLIDTLDCPTYSISVEKLRLSFRSSYSLLDKIAGFLNAYLNLGIDPERVTIRNLWHNKQALRHQFETRPNWHLHSLYWLSRDVADDHDEDAKIALEPDARDLKKLRHTLEHRCLTVRDINLGDDMGSVEAISLKAFEAKAMKLLKLVRAAVVHLALAVNYEERDRRRKNSGRWMGAHLPTYRRRSAGR